MPPVYDQGALGSCTANAIAAAIEYDLMRQKLAVFTPSRLFIYFNERSIEGTASQDSGAAIRDGVKTINSIGVCPETEWPYDIQKFADKPGPQCYSDALKVKSVNYESVNQDAAAIKLVLTEGIPVVMGFTVYGSFESAAVAATGVVPMPSANEDCLGGHAVLICGANDASIAVNGIPPGHFLVRNSWGAGWGAGGYFFAPFEYFLNENLASDFWAIQVMA